MQPRCSLQCSQQRFRITFHGSFWLPHSAPIRNNSHSDRFFFCSKHFVQFVNTCSAYCTVHPDRRGSVGCHLLGTFVNVKVLQVSVSQPVLGSCKMRIILFCVLLIYISENFVIALCSGAVQFCILMHFLWRNNNVLRAGRLSVRDVPSAAKPFVLYEHVQYKTSSTLLFHEKSVKWQSYCWHCVTRCVHLRMDDLHVLPLSRSYFYENRHSDSHILP
jgi:hypothetical protein